MHGATRWLSRGRGCRDHIRSYKALVVCLNAMSNGSSGSDTKAKAQGLLNVLRKPTYILTLLLFADVCAVTDNLSLKLQRESVDISLMKDVRRAKQALTDMKSGEGGPNLKNYPNIVADLEAAGLETRERARRDRDIEDPLATWRSVTKNAFLQGIIDELEAYWPGTTIADALLVLFDPADGVVDEHVREAALHTVLDVYATDGELSVDVCREPSFLQLGANLTVPPQIHRSGPLLDRTAVLAGYKAFSSYYGHLAKRLADQAVAAAEQLRQKALLEKEAGEKKVKAAEVDFGGLVDAVDASGDEGDGDDSSTGDVDSDVDEEQLTVEDVRLAVEEQQRLKVARVRSSCASGPQAKCRRIDKREVDVDVRVSMATVIAAALNDCYVNDKFKPWLPLLQVALVFPVVSVDVERAFSALKLTVTDKRTRLKASTKDRLLRVSHEMPREGGALKELVARVTDKWLDAAARKMC